MSSEARFGHVFRDPSLIATALTHTSFANERGGPHNERLEFLGDAVLQLCTTQLLFHRFPGVDEGALTTYRQRLVEEASLATVARELDLGPQLVLGRGEESSGGRERSSNLACAVEAILGAVYLDAGLEAAQRLVEAWFEPRIEAFGPPDGAAFGDKSPISQLQEFTQARWKLRPTYRDVGCEGDPHAPTYTVEVWVNDACVAQGKGSRKKDAQKAAAREALSALRLREASAT